MRPGERSTNLILALVTIVLALIIGIVLPLASGDGMRGKEIPWTPRPTATATPTRPAATLMPATPTATLTPRPAPTATPTLAPPTATVLPTATVEPAATVAPTATATRAVTLQPTLTVTPTVAAELTPTAQAPASTPAGATTARVLVEPLNLRVGPGTNFATLGIARQNEVYDLRGRNADGSWYQVCCVRNATAWVKAEFVATDGAVDALPIVP